MMIDKALLSKYFDGTCTQQEEQQVLKYLAGRDHQEFISLMEQSWDDLPAGNIGEDITRRMLMQLEMKTYGRQQVIPIERASQKWRKSWLRVAAAVVFMVTGTTYWLITNRNHTTPITWTTIYNDHNNPELAVLPDNSKVWLAPGSKLSYTPFTGKGQRSIKLDGEAFFDVAQNASRPFVVYTDKLATRVLGTTFNIEAYPHEAAVRVSLVSGLVTVASADSADHMATRLHPGDVMDYEKSSHTFKRQQIKINDPQEWTSGSLVFNDLPLTDAVQRVAARYHLVIHYAKGTQSALSDKKITAIFRKESSSEILNNILFISNCYIQQHGQDITVYNMP
ncbi:FecR family protein [Chitinophaga sp. ARDCPP14]|uniref:FecR family protein n=1 Tax=Chitinophaga sp. ARDCPP14 TaxID=3391139 RepID=UPI003F51B6EF